MAVKWINKSVGSVLYGVDIPVSENGQTLIDWNSYPGSVGYTLGIGMIDVYKNGSLLLQGAYTESTTTSINYTDNANPLVAGDVISIRYRPTEINLGNLSVVASYADLLNRRNPSINEVVIVSGTKKFYIYTIDGWEEFVVPFTSQNIGLMFTYEKQVISDPLDVTFELTYPYQVGMNNLLVFIDGVKVDPSVYTEVDSNHITFNSSMYDTLSEIEFLIANNDSWEDSNNHHVVYSYNVDGDIIGETVYYNENIIQSTAFGYDSEGNITTEVISKSSKVITKTYGYDSEGNITSMDVIIS